MPDVFVEETKVLPKEKPKQQPPTPIIKPSPKRSLWHRIKQPLMAYMANPVDMHFESQEEKEEICLLLRRHPITNMPWIVGALVMLFAPLAVFPILSFLNPLPDLTARYQLIFTLFWYTITFSVVLVNYLEWYFNVYFVTNQRIIDVDFNNLVHRELSSTRVAKIQDVTYKVNGVIRSIIDYGDVFIQTAGTEENFIFEAVPQPQEVVKQIGELIEKKEESAPAEAQGV
ncbi:PH domain-containing protein [Candidatus Gottesmanbacteria bacterium]|nr:PH domain-containing protein [Candidatus Gottesmanbacteria bacterium]